MRYTTRGVCGAAALLSTLLLGLAAPQAHAQVELSTGLYYGSPYVFRGALFSSGFVFQPSIEASYNGAFAGFFGNIDPSSSTTSTGNKVAFNEADLFAGYGTEVGPLSLTGTYTYYTFPAPGVDPVTGEKELTFSPTQEVALSLGAAAPLAPSALLVYDFKAFKGFYGEVGVSPAVDLGGQEVTFGALLGIDAGYLLPDSSPRLAHVTASASTPFDLGPLSVSPLVALQVSVDETYRTEFARPVVFYGGLSFGL